MGSTISGDASSRPDEAPNVLSSVGFNDTIGGTTAVTTINGQTTGNELKSDFPDRPPLTHNPHQNISSDGLMDILSTNATGNASTTIEDISSNQDDDEFSVKLFGYILYPCRWMTITSLSSWLRPIASVAMIVGCVLPYLPQYLTIYKTRNSKGFSTFVCLTLLLANIFRIAFWFGHPYEIPLLIQSIVMILAQILLLELCIKVKMEDSNSIERTLFTSNPRWFFRWTDLGSYMEFLIIISGLLGLAVYFFIDCEVFIETLGFLALGTESMLALPQLIKNYKHRSVLGMSLSMVLMWLAGDTFKTGYFIANSSPYQFWICGLTQITIDLLILFQVCLYRQRAPRKNGLDQKRSHSLEISDSPKEMMAL